MKTRRQITSRPRVEELEGRLVPSTLTTSGNWSGYAVVTNPNAVTAVYGTWVVPTVQNTANGYSSAWVGIDGYSSNSVEQIGTEMDYSHGQATYYAWYEMYPSGSVELPLAIKPNDTISASVTYSSNVYTLTLSDKTSGKSSTISQKASGLSRSSAEWIVEAPSDFFGTLPLDNFGTVQFSTAYAAISGKTGAINTVTGGAGVEQINMINDQGPVTGDTTSGLSDSGSTSSSFSVAATVTSPSPSPTPNPTPPSGHHRGGGGWGWWSPMVLAIASSSPASTVAATVGTMTPGLANATSVHVLPGTSTVAPSATPVAAPALTSVAAQSSAALAGTTGVLSDANAGPAVQPSAPNSCPRPTSPTRPAQRALPPAQPDPAPLGDDLAAGLQGSAFDWRKAADACFAQQRWEPAPALDGARAGQRRRGGGEQFPAGRRRRRPPRPGRRLEHRSRSTGRPALQATADLMGQTSRNSPERQRWVESKPVADAPGSDGTPHPLLSIRPASCIMRPTREMRR